ncbi:MULTISPECIES: hypothetical protein [Actinomadura]|uniref:Uncharacterized protein n=2 Tax=Actinomadura yumaensis TaxID=111807 RepID=A0ABW2CSP3_9ACTN|nr:hypothetical protein [Actinomadura sp. J1-007]MWK37613.1 hypothetical protein [Actinomadura sp. J1-007]
MSEAIHDDVPGAEPGPAPRPPGPKKKVRATVGRRGAVIAAVAFAAVVITAAVLTVRSLTSDGDWGDPADPFEPARYTHLSARDFAKLGKSPDDFKGRRIIIYGKVMSFDSTTGSDTFRAVTGHARLTPNEGGYLSDYEQNTFLKGTKKMLADVVQKDVFEAYATVRGKYDYESALGAGVSSIKMRVDKITVYATAK